MHYEYLFQDESISVLFTGNSELKLFREDIFDDTNDNCLLYRMNLESRVFGKRFLA